MAHRFPPPDHVEVEMTAAEAQQEWFDEWLNWWLSDQSDEGYEAALADDQNVIPETRAERNVEHV